MTPLGTQMKPHTPHFEAFRWIGRAQTHRAFTSTNSSNRLSRLPRHKSRLKILSQLSKLRIKTHQPGKAGLFSMETASPAVHTLPAERLALAAPLVPGLRPTCEEPQKLLSLIHPRDSACSLLGTAQRHQGGQHSTATHPPNP